MRYAITISTVANLLERHMHVRAGTPSGQDDAVQQARA
jgi:hypothetical protein